ncbi:MAG: SWIM zinc finger family protein [Ktedonobacterales bacterium]
MEIALAYDRRTSLALSAGGAALDFAANLLRKPVSFRGRVKEPLLLRQLLLALHTSVVSDQRFDEETWLSTLDPVITVHDDQLFFEAFSSDQSVYVRLSAPLDVFEVEGEIRFGTTNIDFNVPLSAALRHLRSARSTILRIGAGGLGVTTSVGGAALDHFERKVDVPESWLKGFLQVQGALAMPAYRFDVHPADLLTVIAFSQEHRAPHPPHGLRYEFTPGGPIRAVLEPWEQRFTLRDTLYSGYARSIRLWGRKRLELLREVLPFASRVQVSVLGRGLPHCYTCYCGPYRFLLALSGWTDNDWATDIAFDLLAPQGTTDAQTVARVHSYLGEHLAAPAARIAGDTSLPPAEVERALFELCRAGRVMADSTMRQYRLRELFAEPLDASVLFAPDSRTLDAERLIAGGDVVLRTVTPPKQSGDHPNETKALAVVTESGRAFEVTVAVDETGRLRFGRCQCEYFERNLMSRGPCLHIMAARLALEAALPERARLPLTEEALI